METHLALRQLGAAHEGRSGLLLTVETELLSCRRVFNVALIELRRKKKHPAVMLLLLFAALGGRIPATVLLLLIVAHSVVVLFTAAVSSGEEGRVKGWRSPFSGQEKTWLFCEEDEVVLYIWPGVSLVFFFRKGAAVRVFWFTSKGKGNEVSGDGKGGLGQERELLMRVRHRSMSRKHGKERDEPAVCGAGQLREGKVR
ncbi:hypothetical protein POTOM_016477 [Populus tomentosa]|uniref:Uncharacterized protein n=1 Tax=Populus tomentosa TaxID=118781 RepID=A0A8X8D726_POPTO|nr:hypothetical protein POTOM_016477 [Populus tomentosa]